MRDRREHRGMADDRRRGGRRFSCAAERRYTATKNGTGRRRPRPCRSGADRPARDDRQVAPRVAGRRRRGTTGRARGPRPSLRSDHHQERGHHDVAEEREERGVDRPGEERLGEDGELHQDEEQRDTGPGRPRPEQRRNAAPGASGRRPTRGSRGSERERPERRGRRGDSGGERRGRRHSTRPKGTRRTGTARRQRGDAEVGVHAPADEVRAITVRPGGRDSAVAAVLEAEVREGDAAPADDPTEHLGDANAGT